MESRNIVLCHFSLSQGSVVFNEMCKVIYLKPYSVVLFEVQMGVIKLSHIHFG